MEVDVVSETVAWISPRMPVSPAAVNGTVTVLSCSDPNVKDAGVPIVPVAFENEIVPAQDGAAGGLVLLLDTGTTALFTTVMEAVSVLPRPKGGKT